MVYDLIYDESGNIKDVRVMQSSHGQSNYHVKTKTNVNTNHRLYHNSRQNVKYEGGLLEGSLNLTSIRSSGWKNIENSESDQEYSILRFLTKEDENILLNYIDPNSTDLGTKIYNNYPIKLLESNLLNDDAVKSNFYTSVANMNSFSKLKIIEEVNVEENKLNYVITIKNNSDKAYSKNIVVTESISEYVTYKENSLKIDSVTKIPDDITRNETEKINSFKCNIGKLAAGSSKIITYTVDINADAMNNPNFSERTQDRIDYSNLYIEKTVDAYADDIVEEGDILTYTINIKNNSNSAYIKPINVTETIPEYVTYVDGSMKINNDTVKQNGENIKPDENRKISFSIGILEAKEEKIIQYSVTINKGTRGNTIESTGMVEHIPSSVVKNKIGNNLSDDNEQKIINCYNTLKEEYKGKELINKIYEQALGINLKLYEDETHKFEIEDLIKNSPKAKVAASSLTLNSNNFFYNMVLNKYWSSLYEKSNSAGEIIEYDLKRWRGYNDVDRRADTINSENFKTGDILIYKNKQDYTTFENGEYAYIFIEGKGFVGINLGTDLDNSKDDRNEFNAKYYSDMNLRVYSDISEDDNDILEYANYQTLFGKDYYVILRPSLMMYNINYELDDGKNDSSNPSIFMQGDSIELKNPTKEGFIFDGWYLENEYLNKITKLDEITKDTTIYAKWKIPLVVGVKDMDEDTKEGITYLIGNMQNITEEEIKEKIETNGEKEIIAKGPNGEIGTGSIIRITKEGQEPKEYTLVIIGDLTGDGIMNDIDLLKMARYGVGLDKNLTGAYLEASNIEKDEDYANDLDLLKMARILVGLDNL